MMKTAKPVATTPHPGIRPPVVMTARVTRTEEITPPVGREGGVSIGQFIDEYMASVAEGDGLVETFSLDIDPEFFRGMYAKAPTTEADYGASEVR